MSPFFYIGTNNIENFDVTILHQLVNVQMTLLNINFMKARERIWTFSKVGNVSWI